MVHTNEAPAQNDTTNNNSPLMELSETTEKRKRTPPPDGMSRSAYKRLKRQQEWEASKGARKAKRKEKEKIKKEVKKASKGDSDHAVAPPVGSTAQKRQQSTQIPVTFIIDCDFDDLMTENEIKSLASQITRCYSDNVKSKYKVHLAVSSFNKRLKERFDTVLEKQYEHAIGQA
jgi:tRNA (guanine9-N1)-methyltransferase